MGGADWNTRGDHLPIRQGTRVLVVVIPAAIWLLHVAFARIPILIVSPIHVQRSQIVSTGCLLATTRYSELERILTLAAYKIRQNSASGVYEPVANLRVQKKKK